VARRNLLPNTYRVGYGPGPRARAPARSTCRHTTKEPRVCRRVTRMIPPGQRGARCRGRCLHEARRPPGGGPGPKAARRPGAGRARRGRGGREARRGRARTLPLRGGAGTRLTPHRCGGCYPSGRVQGFGLHCTHSLRHSPAEPELSMSPPAGGRRRPRRLLSVPTQYYSNSAGDRSPSLLVVSEAPAQSDLLS
jgi:hypothetical protein